MGLFNLGGSSKKTQTTTYETNTDESLTSVDNKVIGDGAIVGSDITAREVGSITTTDYGAIEQAAGIAKGALDYSSNVLANAFTFGDSALKNTLLFGESAQETARQSNQLIKDYGVDIATLQNEATKNSLNFANDALQKTTDLASGAVSKISDVVKGANTSDSVQTIKFISFAVVGVVVALFVLPQIFKE